LAIFRQRLLSGNEYFQLFLICLLPVNIWGIIILMRRLPTLVLLMSTANLLGLSAYVLAFALLESVIIFGFIFITSLSIPKRFLGSKFVPIGATVILVASIAAALVHLYDAWDIEALEFDLWAAMWILIGIALMVLSGYWVNRSNKLEDITRSAVERLSILAMVYLCADIVGLFVILFRNLIR
jgi:hypothetical protein